MEEMNWLCVTVPLWDGTFCEPCSWEGIQKMVPRPMLVSVFTFMTKAMDTRDIMATV